MIRCLIFSIFNSILGQCIQVIFENITRDWSDFFLALVTNITVLNRAVLESVQTIGYLCSTLTKKDVIEENIDALLTGLMFSMRQSYDELRLVSLRAFLHCIDCCCVNMSRRQEVKIIRL